MHELRTPEPALDVRLFRSRGLTTGSLIVSLQFFASLGFFVISPQYLQITGGFDPARRRARAPGGARRGRCRHRHLDRA